MARDYKKEHVRAKRDTTRVVSARDDLVDHRPVKPAPLNTGTLPVVTKPERYGKRMADNLVREMGVNPFKVRYDD